MTDFLYLVLHLVCKVTCYFRLFSSVLVSVLRTSINVLSKSKSRNYVTWIANLTRLFLSVFRHTGIQAYASTTKFWPSTLLLSNDITFHLSAILWLVKRSVDFQDFVLPLYACMPVIRKEHKWPRLKSYKRSTRTGDEYKRHDFNCLQSEGHI